MQVADGTYPRVANEITGVLVRDELSMDGAATASYGLTESVKSSIEGQ